MHLFQLYATIVHYYTTRLSAMKCHEKYGSYACTVMIEKWFKNSCLVCRKFRNIYYLVRPEIWLNDIWETHKCKYEEITKYFISVKIILTVFSTVEASIHNALKDCGLWKPSLLVWEHHSYSKNGSIIFAANE